MIAQVDEEHAAVVSNAMAPARKADVLANVAVAKSATGVGAVAVHAEIQRDSGPNRPFGGRPDKVMQARICQGNGVLKARKTAVWRPFSTVIAAPMV
jgi:hypothetical protein